MQIQYYCYGCSINTTDFPVVNVYVTDFPVVIVHVDELSSAWIWQHKLYATLSPNVNINYRLPNKVDYRICTVRYIRIEIIHGSQNVFWVLTWVGGYIRKLYPSPQAGDKILIPTNIWTKKNHQNQRHIPFSGRFLK